MIDILASMIMVTCMSTQRNSLNWDCVDFVNNCSVGDNGEIEDTEILKCIEEYEQLSKTLTPKSKKARKKTARSVHY